MPSDIFFDKFSALSIMLTEIYSDKLSSLEHNGHRTYFPTLSTMAT
jgi:hypothetical protein